MFYVVNSAGGVPCENYAVQTFGSSATNIMNVAWDKTLSNSDPAGLSSARTIYVASNYQSGQPSATYSTDGGATWADCTGTNTVGYRFMALNYLPTVGFVMQDDGGSNINQQSADGISWSARTPTYTAPTTGIRFQQFTHVHWNGANYFWLAMGYSEANSTTALWSTQDGFNWTRSDIMPFAAMWSGIMSNGTQHIAWPESVGGAASNKIATASSMFGTWTERTTSQTPTNYWQSGGWNGRCFFLADFTGGTSTKGVRSYDGGLTWENWTQPSTSISRVYGDPTSGNMIAVGGDIVSGPHDIWCSNDDGTTWAQATVTSLTNKYCTVAMWDRATRSVTVLGSNNYNPTKYARRTY